MAPQQLRCLPTSTALCHGQLDIQSGVGMKRRLWLMPAASVASLRLACRRRCSTARPAPHSVPPANNGAPALRLKCWPAGQAAKQTHGQPSQPGAQWGHWWVAKGTHALTLSKVQASEGVSWESGLGSSNLEREVASCQLGPSKLLSILGTKAGPKQWPLHTPTCTSVANASNGGRDGRRHQRKRGARGAVLTSGPGGSLTRCGQWPATGPPLRGSPATTPPPARQP